MAKFKLSLKNSFALVFAFFGSFISTSMQAQEDTADTGNQNSPKAAGEEAAKSASGSLSAGAIAAAVAAAAAIAAVVDSGDGGGAAPVPTPTPPAPTPPAPTPAPTETYTVDVVVPTVVNVNTTTNTATTTNTVTGVYLPNTNTNTNTSTNTSTTTMTRYVTNTNTSTATATNTNTTTNTTTNTATQTYGTDADSDGFLQTSEIDPSGSDFLFIDEADNQTANFEQDIVQEFMFIQGGGSANDVAVESQVPDGTFVQDITIQQPVYDIDAFNDYNAPGNVSQDDYFTELGSNIQVVSGPDADGWFEITQDFVQEIDQDIVQDVFYEIEIVQDFIQTQEINQTYTADVIQTETRTRLVGE